MTEFEYKNRLLVRLGKNLQEDLHAIKEALAAEGIMFPSPKHPAIEYAPSTLVGFLIRFVAAEVQGDTEVVEQLVSLYEYENPEKEKA